MARCPVTGQAGGCPAQQEETYSSSSSASAAQQKADLWHSLLERNGHSTTSSSHSSFQKTCEQADNDNSVPALNESDTFSISSNNSNTSSPSRQRQWPSYDQVSTRVMTDDYRDILTSTANQHPPSNTRAKMLCPHGVVCQAKLEFFVGDTEYTGLLQPGQTVEHCLVRLSSALRPVDHGGGPWAKAMARKTFGPKLAASQILPAAAIKCFRNHGHPSGNLLFLGSKVGQPDRDFFQHALCTAVTEKIPSLAMPFLRRFSRYSKYPLSLGLSALSQTTVDGEEEPNPNFPFALCLIPVVSMESVGDHSFDAFLEDIPNQIAPGTHLFDLFAAPTPESVGCSDQLQRIGRIVSTSPFVHSDPHDGLTFRHQVKEDDFELKPDWEDRMHKTVIEAPDGEVGPVSKLTGWHIFEENIQQKRDYVDFEKKTSRGRSTRFSADKEEWDVNMVPGWKFCGFQKAEIKVQR